MKTITKRLKKSKSNRDARGRLLKGCVLNPKGRPKGSPNKVSAEVREVFGEYGLRVAYKIASQALSGCTKSQDLIISRLTPVLKSEGLPLGCGVATDYAGIQTALQQGSIAPDTAQELMNILLIKAKIQDLESFEKRLQAIEIALQEKS